MPAPEVAVLKRQKKHHVLTGSVVKILNALGSEPHTPQFWFHVRSIDNAKSPGRQFRPPARHVLFGCGIGLLIHGSLLDRRTDDNCENHLERGPHH